jgi:hypothetical protein
MFLLRTMEVPVRFSSGKPVIFAKDFRGYPETFEADTRIVYYSRPNSFLSHINNLTFITNSTEQNSP